MNLKWRVGNYSWAFLSSSMDLHFYTKVCSSEKLTKRSTELLLRLISFSAEQTLMWKLTWQCNGFEISILEVVHAINFKENYFAIRECHSIMVNKGMGYFLIPILLVSFQSQYRDVFCMNYRNKLDRTSFI